MQTKWKRIDHGINSKPQHGEHMKMALRFDGQAMARTSDETTEDEWRAA